LHDFSHTVDNAIRHWVEDGAIFVAAEESLLFVAAEESHYDLNGGAPWPIQAGEDR
jgi:hypothetical protein